MILALAEICFTGIVCDVVTQVLVLLFAAYQMIERFLLPEVSTDTRNTINLCRREMEQGIDLCILEARMLRDIRPKQLLAFD